MEGTALDRGAGGYSYMSNSIKWGAVRLIFLKANALRINGRRHSTLSAKIRHIPSTFRILMKKASPKTPIKLNNK